MPTLTLSNEEYDRIMRERQSDAVKATGYCEDYPCCGHTPDDPCTYEWYDNPHRMAEWAQAHSYCDHEAGIYSCEDRYEDDDVAPEDCDHDDTALRKGRHVCRDCGSPLVMVTDVSETYIWSKTVPGVHLWVPVLGVHFERRDA